MKFLYYDVGDKISNIHLKGEIYGYLRGFLRAGYESILVSGRIFNPPEEGIRYIETQNEVKGVFSVFYDFLSFIKILLKEQPDVVWVFHNNILLPFSVILYSFLMKLGRNTTIKRGRTIWVLKIDYGGKVVRGQTKLKLYITRAGYAISSIFVRFIVIENSCAYSDISKLVIQKRKLRIIPISYSGDFFKPVPYESTNRKRVVLSVGRINADLGLTLLITAFQKIVYDFGDWKLVIVGPKVDDEYFKEVTELIHKLGIEDKVEFMGYLDDNELLKLYQTSSIFCRPSIYFANQAVRLEAAVNGLPVITSDTGCKEYDSSLGMRVFKHGDVDELADALKELMSNEKLRAKMSIEQLKKIAPFDVYVSNIVKEFDVLLHRTGTV